MSTWYPQIIRVAAAADSLSIDQGNHRVAMASLLFNAGGVLGYASWGFIADAIGRRKAFGISFVISAITVVYLFPFERSYTEFLVAMPVMGFGLFGALSGTFVYGPEIFPPSVRATGMALANSVGRYVTAAGPLIAGVIAVSWFGGNLGLATTSVAAFGLIALVGLAFAPETKGAALPTDPDVPPTATAIPPDHWRPPPTRRTGHDRRSQDHQGARAIVVGGSIGGLTTALLLRDLGFDVTIFERTPERAGRPRQRHRPAAGHFALVHRAEHPEPGPAVHLHPLGAVPGRRRRDRAPGGADLELHRVGHLLPRIAGRLRAANYISANSRQVTSSMSSPRPCGSSAAGSRPRTWWSFADGITSMACSRIDPTATMTYSGYVGWRGRSPSTPCRPTPGTRWRIRSVTRWSDLHITSTGFRRARGRSAGPADE